MVGKNYKSIKSNIDTLNYDEKVMYQNKTSRIFLKYFHNIFLTCHYVTTPHKTLGTLDGR